VTFLLLLCFSTCVVVFFATKVLKLGLGGGKYFIVIVMRAKLLSEMSTPTLGLMSKIHEAI